MGKPFSTIKVLDLTHVLAGPFCAWQFALLGADVIKIENPDEPDWARGRGPDPVQNAAQMGLNYQVQGTNKRAVAIDLRSDEGRAVVLRMAGTADVLIENFRTGALAGRGLGYEDVIRVNPAIIYCSITGYGEVGPRAEVNAYDNVIQASSGVIDQSAGCKPGLSFVDYAAGYNAAFAVSAALFRRQREGTGSHVTCSMYETALMLMAPEVAATFCEPQPAKQKEPGISAYDTASGKLMLGAFTPRQNVKLWLLLEQQGFDVPSGSMDTPDWPSLWSNAERIGSALSAIFLTRTAAEWQVLLHKNGLPGERVRSLSDAASDPQLAARGFFSSLPRGSDNASTLPVGAYRLDHDGPSIDAPAPRFGEHTDAILGELGLTADEIQKLRSGGVVA